MMICTDCTDFEYVRTSCPYVGPPCRVNQTDFIPGVHSMAHGKPSVSELRAGEAWIQVGLWGPGPRPRPLPGEREGRDQYTAIQATCVTAAVSSVFANNGSPRVGTSGGGPPTFCRNRLPLIYRCEPTATDLYVTLGERSVQISTVCKAILNV